MKQLMVFAFAAVALAASAVDTPAKGQKKRLTTAERQAIIYKHTGGKIDRPNSQKGRIVFLNAQKKMPVSEIQEAIKTLEKAERFNFVIEEGTIAKGSACPFTAEKTARKADVLVALIDDPAAPTFLAAPEEHWAVVNAAKLDAGLKGDAVAKFSAPRFRKQIMRALVHAVGTATTQFPDNIIWSTNLMDLDHCGEFIPMDALMRMKQRLKEMNVIPVLSVAYMTACREGWAPAPTNDVQKAIWDKAHTLPDKPIKIEYDAKKGE